MINVILYTFLTLLGICLALLTCLIVLWYKYVQLKRKMPKNAFIRLVKCNDGKYRFKGVNDEITLD
jgi:hypothetical protein